MARYLVTYHGSAMPDDPAMAQQALTAFNKWVQDAGEALVDPGAPTTMVDQVCNTEPLPPVEIGGYSILETATKTDAVNLLKTHPYVGRGGTLQVNEVMDF